MNNLEFFSNSPLLNLTDHQPEPPIFSSTPLVLADKPLPPAPSSTSSSFFLPLTENTQNNEQLTKLNEDLCLLGLYDFVPKTLNIDQTVSTCRQLVKNYNKLSHEKHLLYEKLKKYECEQVKYDKQEDTIKHDLGRLQISKDRLSDDIHGYVTKISQLTQTIQSKDKEIRRLNQLFAQQNALAKHQYRTLEKQMVKLKERVLTCEKTRFATSEMAYSWPLLLNESIVTPVSSSEMLLKKICYDYDQKHRLLMIENEQLRQCVIDINRQLERLLLLHRSPTDPRLEIDDDEKSFETRMMELPCTAVNEIIQRHFSKIYDQLDRYLLYDKVSTIRSEYKDDIKQNTSIHDHFLPS
ncbi:unnamed protein product [Adineta ricciae]|uniref:Uncharacterized protein n=1 Tax=Adineta ricciae TaxID=249248 RepID=A0A815Y6U8_ADIRI|nr:unnamed protein product [Adineta ricciae]CAF1566576.1 unnamed protein product [Adineta ricciae]